MNIKKDGCDFKELENVLSQYIEKDQVETFVKKYAEVDIEIKKNIFM